MADHDYLTGLTDELQTRAVTRIVDVQLAFTKVADLRYGRTRIKALRFIVISPRRPARSRN